MTQATCTHSRAYRNETLLEDEGEVVWLCPDCRGARLDKTDTWIPAQYGMADYLRTLVMPARNASMSRDEMARTSRSSDPRWNTELL